MRYPVENFKTEWNTTAGYGFGAKTSYGYHDGIDLNDNGGGNSDLGKKVQAIANGDLVYYHTAKHPGTGFGYHNVYKIVGAWGTRWVHQAHLMSDALANVQGVKEGDQVGLTGNSGTTWAHIHYAIFKVDPATLPNGIDTIASTQQQLNDWWEDPIAFIEKWMNNEPTMQIKVSERDWLVGRATVAKEVAEYLEIGDPDNASASKYKNVIGGYKARVTELENKIADLEPRVVDAEEEVSTLNGQVLIMEQNNKDLNGKLNASLEEVVELKKEVELQKKKVKDLQKKVGKALTKNELIRLLFAKIAGKV